MNFFCKIAHTGNMLRFVVLWIFLLQATPSQSAAIDSFQKELYSLKDKCSSLDTKELFESSNNYTSRCSSSDKLQQISHLSEENRSDALCLLFLNNYINLCSNVSELRVSFNMSEVFKSIVPKIKENEVFCSKLNLQPMFEKSILTVLSTNKEVCEKACTDFYGEVLPMCTYSYMMLSLSKQLENYRSPSQNNHVPAVQDKNENTSNNEEIMQKNVIEEMRTIANKVDSNTELKKQNTVVNEQKLTVPPHNNVEGTSGSAADDTQINLTHNKSQNVQKNEKSQVEKKPESNFAETIKPTEHIKKIDDETKKPQETKQKDDEKINSNNEANTKQAKTNKPDDFEQRQAQEVKNTQETNNIESSVKNINVDVHENKQPESTVAKNRVVPSSPVKNEPSVPIKASTQSTKIIDEQFPEYEGDEFASDLGDVPMRKSDEVKVAKPYRTDESEVTYPIEMDGDSYFFSYFMMLCIVFVLGYVGYHNKQKILAIIVEGRRGKRQTRGRRPNSANYHKLDSNLEEAVTSACSKSASQVIY